MGPDRAGSGDMHERPHLKEIDMRRPPKNPPKRLVGAGRASGAIYSFGRGALYFVSLGERFEGGFWEDFW